MFQCNHCHTEYGGIRGISAESCPRCRAQGGSGRERRPASPLAAPARWSSQLVASSRSLVASPPLGRLAQLDRAARF